MLQRHAFTRSGRHIEFTNMCSVVLETSTQSFTFVLSHEITTSFLEKDLPHIILLSVRDTNLYFRLKNLHVNHLRENLPLVVENVG